jgi:2-methylcitrate dehydratase PrpD
MAPLEELAIFVSQGVRGGVSTPLRARLELHVADTLVAWVATAGTQEARNLRQFRNDNRPAPADCALDILINCALTRLSEVDDIHLASMITPGAIIIPGTLTIAATMTSDRAAVCEAIVAGYEAMIRLGLALDGPTILYRGIWPSYLAAPFGIAAAAARLLDLSPAEAAHALALALTLAAPGVGHHNATTGARWFAAGSAARNGLLAAQAARAGFTSDLNILEGSFFATVFGITPKTSALIENLGTSPKLDQVSFKPWCAARQTMAATQALLEILDGGVAAADITAIEVSVPPPFLKMVDHGIVGGRIARLTSQPYQMAMAALAQDLAYDVAQMSDVPTDVLRLMNKIAVRPNEDLLDGFPRQWLASVRVRTPNSEHQKLIRHVPGDPERPFDESAIKSKASRLTGSTADRIIDQCRAMFEGRMTPEQLVDFINRACAAADSSGS